jgi:DNA polymerase IV
MNFMQKIILHFDMNSYFASVEQQANPFLRGQPVGVCSTMSRRGCIIASSKEAKGFGVKTGCRVDEAQILCPQIRLVEVDPPKYRTTTQRIFGLCKDYTSEIELYSIDEGFLDLTGLVKSFSEAAGIGKIIKARIKNEVGEWLDNSMGIAYTRWLAKFGSDIAPKGGMVVINPANRLNYLQDRDLEEAWGIARALASRLQALGITTLAELAKYSPINLLEVFGIKGYELWANVNGIELAGLAEKQLPKSIGHSHVLRKRNWDEKFHKAVIMRLAEKTGRRLREMNLESHGLYAFMKLEGLGDFGASKKVFKPIITTQRIYSQTLEILAPYLKKGVPTFFALGLFNLQLKSNQLSLFEKPKSEALVKALDRINNKYGEEAIVQGEVIGLDNSHAPDRIGFRKTVGLDA